MSKATNDSMANLHGLLAKALSEKLKSGEYTASDLNVIRQFLKDNGINCDGNNNPVIHEIVDDLPSFEDQDIYVKSVTE